MQSTEQKHITDTGRGRHAVTVEVAAYKIRAIIMNSAVIGSAGYAQETEA